MQLTSLFRKNREKGRKYCFFFFFPSFADRWYLHPQQIRNQTLMWVALKKSQDGGKSTTGMLSHVTAVSVISMRSRFTICICHLVICYINFFLLRTHCLKAKTRHILKISFFSTLELGRFHVTVVDGLWWQNALNHSKITGNFQMIQGILPP